MCVSWKQNVPGRGNAATEYFLKCEFKISLFEENMAKGMSCAVGRMLAKLTLKNPQFPAKPKPKMPTIHLHLL